VDAKELSQRYIKDLDVVTCNNRI